MTISFDIPESVEQLLREVGPDPSQAAKEVVLVELYRQGRFFHSEFARALGVSRYEADGVLKRHGVMLDISEDELREDMDALRKLVG